MELLLLLLFLVVLEEPVPVVVIVGFLESSISSSSSLCTSKGFICWKSGERGARGFGAVVVSFAPNGLNIWLFFWLTGSAGGASRDWLPSLLCGWGAAPPGIACCLADGDGPSALTSRPPRLPGLSPLVAAEAGGGGREAICGRGPGPGPGPGLGPGGPYIRGPGPGPGPGRLSCCGGKGAPPCILGLDFGPAGPRIAGFS